MSFVCFMHTNSYVGHCSFLELREHDFIKALMIHIDNQMSPTITYSQFSSLGLAVRACSFHLQGVTAVVHGWLFVH